MKREKFLINSLVVAAAGLLAYAINGNLGPAHALVWCGVFMAGSAPANFTKKTKSMLALLVLMMPVYYSIIGGWKVFLASMMFWGIQLLGMVIAARAIARLKGFSNIGEYARDFEKVPR